MSLIWMHLRSSAQWKASVCLLCMCRGLETSFLNASGPLTGQGVAAKVQSTQWEIAELTAVHLSSRPGLETEQNDEKPRVLKKCAYWYKNPVIIDSPHVSGNLSEVHTATEPLATWQLHFHLLSVSSQLLLFLMCSGKSLFFDNLLTIMWEQSVLQWASMIAPC